MEILIESTLPVLSGNFEEIRGKLAESLKHYEISVTDENLAQAKAMATELNKMAGEFDRRRKDVEAEVTKPIKAFKDQVDSLIAMCKSGREAILKQVAVFEEQKRQQVLDLLVVELDRAKEDAGINAEIGIQDLVILSNMTPSGSLTKAARDAIQNRVDKVLAQKNLELARVAKAESESLKAGLEPFTESQVAMILGLPDFDQRLEKMIAQELDRQKRIEDVARAKVEAEQKAREAAELKRIEAEKGQIELDRIAKEVAEQKKSEPQPVFTSSGEINKPQNIESPKPGPEVIKKHLYSVQVSGMVESGLPEMEEVFVERIKNALTVAGIGELEIEVKSC